MSGDPLQDFDPRRRASVKLAIVARQMRRSFDDQVADLGVTRSQWGAIAVVSRIPGTTQKVISEHLEISEVSAGRLVDRLVADGLLERRRHKADGRAHAVYLTEQGEGLTESLDSIARIAESQAFEGFSEADVLAFNELLDRLQDNIAR